MRLNFEYKLDVKRPNLLLEVTINNTFLLLNYDLCAAVFRV